jgi:hypothetical protein
MTARRRGVRQSRPCSYQAPRAAALSSLRPFRGPNSAEYGFAGFAALEDKPKGANQTAREGGSCDDDDK